MAYVPPPREPTAPRSADPEAMAHYQNAREDWRRSMGHYTQTQDHAAHLGKFPPMRMKDANGTVIEILGRQVPDEEL